MTAAAAALAALALIADPPTSDASGAPAPPPVDSQLEQPQMSEAERQAAVQGAYAAAEARRGPLDGRWRLTASDGRALYIFQLSDPGQVPDPRSGDPSAPVIEGAWRDPARPSAAGGSGFLSHVRRDGGSLSVRFVDRDPARPMVVTLRQQRDGVWAGVLRGRRVTMSRF
jgi:hypothetical protein